jgi:hypothetical protein
MFSMFLFYESVQEECFPVLHSSVLTTTFITLFRWYKSHCKYKSEFVGFLYTTVTSRPVPQEKEFFPLFFNSELNIAILWLFRWT